MNPPSSASVEHPPTLCSQEASNLPLTDSLLYRQNRAFQGTSGVSAANRSQRFVPAFMDMETHRVYPSRFADGRPAPVHLLDGLPTELVSGRDPAGKGVAIKSSVIAGFLRNGLFYTLEQAAGGV